MTHTPEPESDDRTMAAHLRMTKCVAACAGIPTDKLRPGIVGELIEAATSLGARGDVLELIERFKRLRALLRELGSE